MGPRLPASMLPFNLRYPLGRNLAAEAEVTMDIETLEREALQLSVDDRARLVQKLFDSLDELPAQERDRLWLEEASRRASQIDAGEVGLVPADEVDRKARALLG